jgi:hypothetical protein
MNYSLTGLPLVSDLGVHPLFVLAMRCNETSSSVELLGVQTVAVNVLAENNSRSYCEKGVSFVATKVSLAVNGIHLNSTQRINVYQWFVTEFELSNRTNSIHFKHEPEKSNVTECRVLKGYDANTSYSGPVLTISWLVGCHLTNVSESFLEKQRRDVVLNYPVIGWWVVNGNDSTLCFPDGHKSAGGSSLEVNRSTYVPSIHPKNTNIHSIHPSSLVIKTTPLPMSGTSVASTPTSVNQQALQTTASYQSNPVIQTTLQQIHFTDVSQSTVIVAQPSPVMSQAYLTQEANTTSFGWENNSIARSSFQMESVTSTLESVRNASAQLR